VAALSGKLNKLYLGLLGLLFFGLGCSMLLLPAKPFSELENRYLAAFPAITWEGIRSGEFGRTMERYAADQFPLRDRWVTMKAWVEVSLNKKENNEVYAGKDGYLLQKLPEPSISLNQQMAYVRSFAEAVGIPVRFLLAPNSAEILSGKLPAYAPVSDQKAYIRQAYRLLWDAAGGVDVYETLRAHRDQSIYYRTDHHWTALGAYYAYQAYARQADLIPFAQDAFRIDKVSNTFYGTLSAKSKFRHVKPDEIDIWLPKETSYSHKVTHLDDGTELDSLYDWEKLNERDQYPVFLGGNHALTAIETSEAPDRTLLLIKDSYAHAMVPFLAQHYNKICMVDLRYLNMSMKQYAAEINADEVLILYNAATFGSDDQLVKLGW